MATSIKPSLHVPLTRRSISLGCPEPWIPQPHRHCRVMGHPCKLNMAIRKGKQLNSTSSLLSQCFPKPRWDYSFIPWVLSSLPTTLYSCQHTVQIYFGAPQLKVGQISFHWAVQMMTKVYLLFKSSSFCIVFFLYSVPKLIPKVSQWWEWEMAGSLFSFQRDIHAFQSWTWGREIQCLFTGLSLEENQKKLQQ